MLRSDDRHLTLKDGRRLAYAEIGSPSGSPIIHCHGTPSSRLEGRLIWDAATAEELGLRIIVPDRPGIGQSDAKHDRQIRDWPQDVVELADALGLQTFAVIGQSGGSPYALACAAALPDRVRVVALLCCIAPLDAAGMMAALPGPLRIMFRLARSAPALLRGLLRLNLRAVRGAPASERMAARFPEPDRTVMLRAEIREGFIACFVEACRNGTHGPVADLGLVARPWGIDLSTLAVPVLLWHGERDGNVPIAHGRYLATAIPRCTARFYPDEGHLSLPLNHGREILSALKD